MSNTIQNDQVHGDILVVDDNISNLKFLTDVLTEAGYRVRPASDGKLALRTVQAKHPDLIILDYKMPGMDGIEVCQHLKDDPDTKDIPIIFLSAFGETKLKVKALETGGIDYVTKPVEPAEILARICCHLNMHRLQRRLAVQSKKLLAEVEERKIVAEKLRLTNEVITHMSEGVYLVQMDGTIVYTNPIFEKMFGYDPGEMIGQNVSIVNAPTNKEPKETAKEIIAILEREGLWRGEIKNIKKDGTPFWCYANVICFDHFEYGKVLVSTHTDITERKQVKTEKKKMQSFVYQQEKMASIGQLAAGVAHEINNPMGFISSNLHTLGKYVAKLIEFINFQESTASQAPDATKALRKKLKIDYIIDDIVDLVEESREGTERVKEIVKNLKNFSRVADLELSKADINECLENTIKVIWNELKYKTEVIKDYGELPAIPCHPQQLNQVFMNLMMNAVHAIESKGTIKIRTWQTDDSVFISISDSGKGITPENIQKIFEPFFTTKEIGKGTGLGLSIAHEIIQKHTGQISVESTVGEGTVFTIQLPLGQEKTNQPSDDQ